MCIFLTEHTKPKVEVFGNAHSETEGLKGGYIKIGNYSLCHQNVHINS